VCYLGYRNLIFKYRAWLSTVSLAWHRTYLFTRTTLPLHFTWASCCKGLTKSGEIPSYKLTTNSVVLSHWRSDASRCPCGPYACVWLYNLCFIDWALDFLTLASATLSLLCCTICNIGTSAFLLFKLWTRCKLPALRFNCKLQNLCYADC